MPAVEDAEAFRGVTGIVETRDGSLWLNGSRGIIYISADDVRNALVSRSALFSHGAYDRVHSIPALPLASPAGYRALNVGFEERLAERTRIAHELHDTLLQGFFGASMRLQAVSNLLRTKSEKAKENLDDVLDQIDVVLEEGRRAIWDMNSTTAAENDLGQAFTLVGEDLNKTYPTDFSLTIEGESGPLHPLVRDQIYRTGREALINAFRHSQATNIELEIEYAPKRLRLVVRDNGCGIQPDVLSAGREGHLGLSGMRKYAEKIGAELKIYSRAESGTEVELIVPQQIAFEKKSSGGLFSRLSRFYRRKNAPRRLNGRRE